MGWGDLAVIIIGVMRLSVMVATEHGPWDVLTRLRKRVGVVEDDDAFYGTGMFSRGLVCLLCNSVWFGLAATALILIFGSLITMLLFLPFCISGGALVLREIWSCLERQQ